MLKNYILQIEGESELHLFRADSKDVALIEDITDMVPSWGIKKAFLDSDVPFTYLYAFKQIVETKPILTTKVTIEGTNTSKLKISLNLLNENCYCFYATAIDRQGKEEIQKGYVEFAVIQNDNINGVKVKMTNDQLDKFLTDPIWKNKAFENRELQYDNNKTFKTYTGPAYIIPQGVLNQANIQNIKPTSFEVYFPYYSPTNTTINALEVLKIE